MIRTHDQIDGSVSGGLRQRRPLMDQVAHGASLRWWFYVKPEEVLWPGGNCLAYAMRYDRAVEDFVPTTYEQKIYDFEYGGAAGGNGHNFILPGQWCRCELVTDWPTPRWVVVGSYGLERDVKVTALSGISADGSGEVTFWDVANNVSYKKDGMDLVVDAHHTWINNGLALAVNTEARVRYYPEEEQWRIIDHECQ